MHVRNEIIRFLWHMLHVYLPQIFTINVYQRRELTCRPLQRHRQQTIARDQATEARFVAPALQS